MVNMLVSVYRRAAALLNCLRSPLLLAIRLYWGFQFAQDGWRKLHNLDRVTSYFASLNLPSPHLTALSVATIEFGGGILLGIGLATRVTSLVLFVNMTVAFWVAEKAAFLAVLSDPDKFQAADAYNYWFAALLILILGPGLIAVDTLIDRLIGQRHPAAKS